MPLAVMAKKEKKQEVDSLGNKIKTGWNFGILPSIAYDADYGFQGGILTNVYYYGDGSQYPLKIPDSGLPSYAGCDVLARCDVRFLRL